MKGGDYTEESVVGATQVRAWGGRGELIPLVEGASTTEPIASSAASDAPRTAPAAFSA